MEEKRHSPVTNRSDTQPEEPNNLHLLVQSIPRSRSGSPHASIGSTNQQGSSSIQTGNSDEKKRRNSGELDGPLPKRTSAIASKFQASLKVKEQQQAIIEARLVSPPGGASNQESFSFNQRPLQPAPLSRLTVPKHTSSNDPYTAPPHSAPPPHDHHNSNQYPPQPYRPVSGPPTATGHYNERSKIPLPPPSPSSHHPPPHSAFPSTTGNYPHHSPPQQQTLHNPYPQQQQQQQQQQQPPPQPLPPSSSTSSRRAFLSLFESVYDTASDDLPKLVATLKDQMRKSSSLLQTLQASGQMIEGLVRSCFRDMQVQYGEKFGAALADLNRRVEVLEGRLGQVGGGGGGGGYGGSQGQQQTLGQARGGGVEYSNTGFRGEPMTPAVKPPSLDFPVPAHSSTSTSGSSGSGQQQHSNSDQTPHDVNALLKSLMDRLDQLEKK